MTILYILSNVYINNCLHWYTFIFTSGSYTCVVLEKVLFGFGSVMGVNISNLISVFLMIIVPKGYDIINPPKSSVDIPEQAVE